MRTLQRRSRVIYLILPECAVGHLKERTSGLIRMNFSFFPMLKNFTAFSDIHYAFSEWDSSSIVCSFTSRLQIEVWSRHPGKKFRGFKIMAFFHFLGVAEYAGRLRISENVERVLKRIA